MGFLDRLIKKETRKLISDVVGNAVDNVIDSINNTVNNSTQNVNTTTATYNADEEHCDWDASVVRARLEKVIANEWPGYELRANISAAAMGAEPEAADYSYGLYLNGEPKAMIMILEGGSAYRKKSVRLAHAACEARGIYCMNLLTHLPNRLSYISGQLSANVRK